MVPPGKPVSAPTAAEVRRPDRFVASGFVIDPSGIIVTNRHVVEGATDILVTLQDNTLLRATLLAQADPMDVALIKVTPATPLRNVRFGDSDKVRLADRVLAIGNPLGFGGSISQGIVSALNRDIQQTPFDDFIQTDAAINHGNSGGPLFNEQGEVVGMNTAAVFGAGPGSGSQGIGFAIPANDVRQVVEALRNPGGMQSGTLGVRIQQVTPEIADALNMPKAEGAIVSGTVAGGGVSQCGIVPGDIILRYGSLEVRDVRALARAIMRTQPGTSVNLLVWRDEEPTVITATVQALGTTAAPVPAPAPVAADAGWQLSSLDERARHALGLGQSITGAVVREVAPNGAAAEAGIHADDVIVQVQKEKVANSDDVERLIELARQQQRHYAIVLIRNTEGLRWRLALSLQ